MFKVLSLGEVALMQEQTDTGCPAKWLTMAPLSCNARGEVGKYVAILTSGQLLGRIDDCVSRQASLKVEAATDSNDFQHLITRAWSAGRGSQPCALPASVIC